MEEQVGGQLKAGFSLMRLYEDRNRPGAASAISACIPNYAATRTMKPQS